MQRNNHRTSSLSLQFTAKHEACRSHLARLVSSSESLHAATVARIIGVMVRTHTGLDDGATLRNMNATGTSLWEKEKVSKTSTSWWGKIGQMHQAPCHVLSDKKPCTVNFYLNAEGSPSLHWQQCWDSSKLSGNNLPNLQY